MTKGEKKKLYIIWPVPSKNLNPFTSAPDSSRLSSTMEACLHLLPQCRPLVDLCPPPLYPTLPLIVGFKVKWHLNFTRGVYHPIGTLHLYIGRCCLVYHIVDVATSPSCSATSSMTQGSSSQVSKLPLIWWSWRRTTIWRWRWGRSGKIGSERDKSKGVEESGFEMVRESSSGEISIEQDCAREIRFS